MGRGGGTESAHLLFGSDSGERSIVPRVGTALGAGVRRPLLSPEAGCRAGSFSGPSQALWQGGALEMFPLLWALWPRSAPEGSLLLLPDLLSPQRQLQWTKATASPLGLEVALWSHSGLASASNHVSGPCEGGRLLPPETTRAGDHLRVSPPTHTPALSKPSFCKGCQPGR